MTKHVEQMMRRAEGALGRAFRQLDAAGNIAKKLDAETTKHPDKDNFVELLIIREVVERVARICNAAFIADSRATSPLPFPPREGTPGIGAAAAVASPDPGILLRLLNLLVRIVALVLVETPVAGHLRFVGGARHARQ